MLATAYLVSTRSLDPHTKHGAVLVNRHHGIEAAGYNGPISGSIDSLVPLTRPAKYWHMLHAEENLMLLGPGGKRPGTTLFITGYPCFRCFRAAVQKGISKIVYGATKSAVVTSEDRQAIALAIKYQRLPRNYLQPASPKVLAEAQQLLAELAARIGNQLIPTTTTSTKGKHADKKNNRNGHGSTHRSARGSR